MILHGVGAAKLDVEGRGQEGAADVGVRLAPPEAGSGGEERLEHGIAGLLALLGLERLLELIEQQLQQLGRSLVPMLRMVTASRVAGEGCRWVGAGC